MDNRDFSPNRWLIGILIVAIGIILLGQNLELLQLNIDINIWKLWPIFIVFVGLSMLKFKSLLANMVSFIVLIAVIAAIGFMVYKGGMISMGKKSSQENKTNIEDFFQGEIPFGQDFSPKQWQDGPAIKS